MFIYWIMFAIPAVAALSTIKYHRHVTDLSWFFVALFYIVIIGETSRKLVLKNYSRHIIKLNYLSILNQQMDTEQ